MLKKILLFIFYLLPLTLVAQQVPQYTLHVYNPLVYNPAYAGMNEFLEGTATVRKQWTQLKGSPFTQNFNINFPFHYLNSGIGMNIENDYIGVERNTKVSLAYAYKINIAKETKLSFGISAGLIQQALDGTKLLAPEGLYEGNIINHNDDFLPNNKQTAISYHIDAGIYLRLKAFQIGFSSLHLTETSIDFNFSPNEDFSYLRHYTAFAKYDYPINEDVSLSPTLFLKTDFIQTQLDVSVLLDYVEKYQLGIAYRGYSSISNDALSLIGGYKLTNNWSIMYAYDFTLSTLNIANKGSHEVLLKYNINKNLEKVKNPKVIYNPRLP